MHKLTQDSLKMSLRHIIIILKCYITLSKFLFSCDNQRDCEVLGDYGFHLSLTISVLLMIMWMLQWQLQPEVNKVAKPTNLVGRKICGSWGLKENISWKSRIVVVVIVMDWSETRNFPSIFLFQWFCILNLSVYQNSTQIICPAFGLLWLISCCIFILQFQQIMQTIFRVG